MGKVLTNKLDIIRRQHEHVSVSHPGREKLHEFPTGKGYYCIDLKSDIQEILKTYSYCQNYKKDNQIRHLPMKISATAHEAFEKIAIDVVIMKTKKTKRGT